MLLCINRTAGDPLGPTVIQTQGPFLKESLTVNFRMKWPSNRRFPLTVLNLSVSEQIICSLLHITCSWMHRVYCGLSKNGRIDWVHARTIQW